MFISRPQTRNKSKSFFLTTCASEKTHLSPETCERSECAAQGCKPFQKCVPHIFEELLIGHFYNGKSQHLIA